jgi:hypothetical protein
MGYKRKYPRIYQIINDKDCEDALSELGEDREFLTILHEISEPYFGDRHDD